MLDTFNQFYDSNMHQTRERNTNRLVRMDCRFSWGTSLAIGHDGISEKKFEKMFSDTANDGFAQRFSYGFFESRIDPKDVDEWRPKANEGEAIAEGDFTPGYLDILRNHVVTGWEPSVKERYRDENQDLYPGAGFQFKSTMVMIACINLHEKVTMADYEAALAWTKWQALIRKVFRPSSADDGFQAKFNETVRRALRKVDAKLAKAGKPFEKRWVNIERLSQKNEWALSSVPMGLAGTMFALRDYGELNLQPDEAEKSGYNWRKARARHWEKTCWCGQEHDEPGE
jgi:hypothetical protein